MDKGGAPKRLEVPPDAGGEASITADAGSTGESDHISEDLFSHVVDGKGAQVGYLGKSSEVVWLTKTAQDLIGTPAEIVRDNGILSPDMALETPTYHMDDVDLTVAGDQIDPFTLPQKHVADALVKDYFDTMHPILPIVLRSLFMVQYESFYKFPFTPESSKRWLAILNAILAIGGVYSHLVQGDKYCCERDHMQFFARARVLSLDGGVVYEVADLQQVQVAGLMGMYLLATSQTNRAWNITGLAIRYAQTLGLHLRTDASSISDTEKEMRARIWYAIKCLEQILAVTTGRPSAIQEKDCSVPLPKPLEDEALPPEPEPAAQSKDAAPATAAADASTHLSPRALCVPPGPASGPSRASLPSSPSMPAAVLFYTEYSKVSTIAVEALNALYCPETMKMSWLEVQTKIADLDRALNQWKAELPPVLDFAKRLRDHNLVRQRMTLAFQHFHTRIIINRPCLCRIDGRIPHESSRSKLFNRSAALACIESARETIKLLPDVPHPVGLYKVSPWWGLFHYLVSAASVIIVEIAMRAEHNPNQASALFNDARKVVYWLKIMGKDNLSANRAWSILSKLLAAAAPKIGFYYHHSNGNGSSEGSPHQGNQQGTSPMVGVEAVAQEGNPFMDFPQSATSGLSVGDLEYLAVYDELPNSWGHSYQNPQHPEMMPPTSMMFPTPQQMQGLDVEESLSRRDSFAQHSTDGQHTPVYPEQYYPQWDPSLDTVMGMRSYVTMQYPSTESLGDGKFSGLQGSSPQRPESGPSTSQQPAPPQAAPQPSPLQTHPSHHQVDNVVPVIGQANEADAEDRDCEEEDPGPVY
ncbi:fungal-specific transcription factor domain-containing protein [Kalaharituber pfeilii]|nr:fungal-specific transcription factor domain-containing protein [Kalaharituber pfeilii]